MFVWKAFFDLHQSRAVGFGPAPLQTSDILSWMQIFQIPPHQRAEMYELLLAMDEEWLSWANSEAKRKTNGDSKATD